MGQQDHVSTQEFPQKRIVLMISLTLAEDVASMSSIGDNICRTKHPENVLRAIILEPLFPAQNPQQISVMMRVDQRLLKNIREHLQLVHVA